jgi:hypothetical protein
VTPNSPWQVAEGDDPIAATAIHHGHEVRAEVAARLKISEADRLREEDPYTGPWTEVAATRLIALRSRFEIDLNRPRERAVYRTPADAWGLELWKTPPPEGLVSASLALYDGFYAELRRVLAGLIQRFGTIVVLDLHSYNHRRAGSDAPPADGGENPEVNVGTGTLDRARFGSLVDRFMEDLRAYPFLGRHLDVRENIKFRGGHLSRWIHESFPGQAAVLAIEFKKFFMDEWTGAVHPEVIEEIPRALRATLPGMRATLGV